MAFQVIVEWVAHALEGMGIAIVPMGGLAAVATFMRRLIDGRAFEAESSCCANVSPAPRCSRWNSSSRRT